MARIRYLKPEFFEDDSLAQLPFECRLAFAGLWCLADREGRLEDSPVRIKARLFSSDLSKINQKVDMDAVLNTLTVKPFIVRYEVEGKKYIEIINFSKHQAIHSTEKKSFYPKFNGDLTVKQRLYKGMGMEKGTYEGMEKGTYEDSAKRASVISEPFDHDLLKNPEILVLWEAWLDVRKRMKVPNTNKALQLAADKLLSWGVDEAKEALKNSIEKGWRGVFRPQSQKTNNAIKPQEDKYAGLSTKVTLR